MITAGLVAFNLLLNGIGSFLIAWLLSAAAVRLFRPRPGPAHLFLLLLPFLKVAIELLRGVPDDSFLWLRARGVPQDLGSFQIGFGVWWAVPQVHLVLSALSGGHRYGQSAADLLAAVLVKRGAPWVPLAIATGLLCVSAARLAARAAEWRRALITRRAVSRSATLIGRVREGRRSVALLVSGDIDGSPFTGGVLAPYICFPKRVWVALEAGERRAAIAHEIAHVAEHHVLLTTLAGIVRDLFWFVPFIGVAERRLREGCELSADARAVRRGTGAEVLASALVRAREVMPLSMPLRAATLGANHSPLRARVARLLDASPGPRLGFQYLFVQAVLTVWVAAAVLRAVAFGNH
jgi:beta-lactamase regulating signal transducer with metallopeptidase domain